MSHPRSTWLVFNKKDNALRNKLLADIDTTRAFMASLNYEAADSSVSAYLLELRQRRNAAAIAQLDTWHNKLTGNLWLGELDGIKREMVACGFSTEMRR